MEPVTATHAPIGAASKRRVKLLQPATQGLGRVLVCCDNRFLVDTGTARVQTRRAASCLLLPMAGDTVAWCGGWADETFIYAVLERGSQTEQCLEIEGDTRLRVHNGGLRLEADEALHLTAKRMEAEAGEVQIKSEKATLIFGAVESFARSYAATLSSLRLIGTQFSSIFERVFQHAQTQQRVVEGIDQVHAGTLDYQGSKLVHLHGETVLTTGERLVKTRAAQIQLG